MSELSVEMAASAAAVEEALDQLLPPVAGPRGRVIEAMRYSCLGGGKRLRPFLVVASADLFEIPRAVSVQVGAALEMIHCYSLVHDDLPAMDDADLRRGRPSVHKAFDEATAILAGDGLLTMAFEVLADQALPVEAETRGRLISELAIAAGAAGMVGGQMIDLSDERDHLDLEGVSELQRLKTGALIRYGCIAGGILGGAGPDQHAALSDYAEDIGLAFQVVDDLLDAFGSTEQLGKPAGQDDAMDKATFVKLLGPDAARAKAEALVAQACGRLEGFGPAAEPLRQIAQFIIERKS